MNKYTIGIFIEKKESTIGTYIDLLNCYSRKCKSYYKVLYGSSLKMLRAKSVLRKKLTSNHTAEMYRRAQLKEEREIIKGQPENYYDGIYT